MSLLAWLAVPLLGGSASIARVLIARHVIPHETLPVGTFLVNITGSLALGILAGSGTAGTTATLIGTATIGTYTTFSTWMLDTHHLHARGAPAHAAANIAISLGTGLLAFALGYAIA
jgi:CrcB protein